MRKQQPPPVKIKMMNSSGYLDPIWVRWFQEVGMFFDDYRRSPDVTYTSNAILNTDDFGKTILFDTSGGDLICTLMEVTAKDIWCWLTIFRSGIGRLSIKSSSTSAIEYGSISGRIYNDEERRKAANVTLQLISATQWGIIGATGTWRIS